MRMLLQGVPLVFMASALGACAGSQSGWQESYAVSPGYYGPSSDYDYRYERDSARAQCRGRYDEYEEDRRGDYPYSR
jgi:hypothetical protein